MASPHLAPLPLREREGPARFFTAWEGEGVWRHPLRLLSDELAIAGRVPLSPPRLAARVALPLQGGGKA